MTEREQLERAIAHTEAQRAALGDAVVDEALIGLRQQLNAMGGVDVQAPPGRPVSALSSERKHVTVVFSDLSGYTAMSEKLDPEEVTEIMSSIFGAVTRVIDELEGSIDKFIGDAVLAVFGVPKAHEDDAVRAIMAAQRIHQAVEAISPEVEARTGRPLTMHTGINSGLIVTGEMDVKTGKAGITGDTINLASRLEALSGTGEILVSPETRREAEYFFRFEDLGPKKVKGRTEPVRVYKVLSQREHPTPVGHLHGVRAELTGRRAELDELRGMMGQVKKGSRVVATICGDAGTGKSRLVEEFKAALGPDDVQWFEGRAYAYRQQTPYAPVIDLLMNVFRVEERDPPETVRWKLEAGLRGLVKDYAQSAAYIGSLFSLRYTEIEEVSPEFWKARLHEGVTAMVSGVRQKGLAVLCFEDLHWADPSSVELLRSLVARVGGPLLILCVYRPGFSLFAGPEEVSAGVSHHPIELHDLGAADADEMLRLLLKTERVPTELASFVREKAEGNPFYMEEVINALIDAEVLVEEGGTWKLSKPIRNAEIPSTVQGVLSARLDRLEQAVRRIVQEAAVIGREFLYEILKRITAYSEQLAGCLSELQRLDLIRLHQSQPDLEYVFKHALTQEVAYAGLLKKERRAIHERIGLVMEQAYRDRLPEFYEALAFHFQHGESQMKAVEYLTRSGEKSLKRYSIEESHGHYREAYLILSRIQDRSSEENTRLVDLIMQWALVYYYRGDFKGLTELLRIHETTAVSLNDRSRLGMFYAWLGFANYSREKTNYADELLRKALKIGEEIDDPRVVGYACTWLTFLNGDLGLFDEALRCAQRAMDIARSVKSEQYLFFKPLGGIVQVCFHTGDVREAQKSGEACLEIGKKYSNVRAMTMGHIGLGVSHLLRGDLAEATEAFNNAHDVSADRLYEQIANMLLGMCYVQNKQFERAESVLQEVMDFSGEYGCEWAGSATSLFMGIVLMSSGRMSAGFKMIESVREQYIQTDKQAYRALAEYILGKIYLQMVQKAEAISLPTMLKNIVFILRNYFFASDKAVRHLQTAIETARKIGAKSVLGMAYLDLGLLYRAKRKPSQAGQAISEAITIFERCGATHLLQQAREAQASLRLT